MRTNLTQRFIIFLTIILLFCSCSDPFKNKYAGRWIETKREIDVISISKNNEDYIVTYQGKRLPAVYKDRNLEVTIGGLKPTMMLEEQTDRILFLEKEYIRIEKSFTNRICGVWNYKNEYNEDSFLKIIKDYSDKYNLQKGSKNGNRINWGNMDGSVGNGEYLTFFNGSLEGKYRNYEGSAADAYTDIKINIGLNSNNILVFTIDNRVFEAIKVND